MIAGGVIYRRKKASSVIYATAAKVAHLNGSAHLCPCCHQIAITCSKWEKCFVGCMQHSTRYVQVVSMPSTFCAPCTSKPQQKKPGTMEKKKVRRFAPWGSLGFLKRQLLYRASFASHSSTSERVRLSNARLGKFSPGSRDHFLMRLCIP